jgi:hypothetical protein
MGFMTIGRGGLFLFKRQYHRRGKRTVWGESHKPLKIRNDFGSGVWTRTTDLGIMRPSLYHLSYAATQQVPPRSGQKILRRGVRFCQTLSGFCDVSEEIIRDPWGVPDSRLEIKAQAQRAS